ncbi:MULTISPECIES: methyl-accepting chemotaxis protein [Paenibacillus]|uniref:Chemotaxis protein n=1 Tax=Paenibacillus campinasensis TaxID=66347 RepID=A0A268EQS8_9BACL|nr:MULTISPECIES: methyl-accepting chemotaxis protein [Paenibacillus]MUG65475.1 HAMP domain-containing protein [Paenibacillus campinasensis]PAD75480.1 chemotaxis protein [Paenibacillus campinasensis]PAK51466.1 chemotaxis protein [Paenibacillus sp. 7541]
MLKSLKLKMIFMICLVLLLSLGSVFLVSYSESSDLLKNSLNKEAMLSAENLASSINDFMESEIAKLDAVGKFLTGNKDEDLAIIKKAQEQHPEFETFFFSHDLTGKNVINFLGEVTDVSDRVHYQEAGKGEGKIVVSDPVLSKRTGNNIVTMILPLMKDGKQYGYMGSTLPINEVQQKVSDLTFGDSGFAFLLSAAGTIMWHPNEELGLEQNVSDLDNAEISNAFEKVKTGETGYFDYVMDGNQYTAAHATSNLNWGVFVTAPTKELHAPINELTITLTLISAAALVLSILAASWLTATVLKPIRQLNEAVKDVAAGDLTKTIKVDGKDEIAVLSSDFNQTVSHLKHLVEGVNSSSSEVMKVTGVVASGVETAKDSVDRIGSSIKQIAEGANAHASSSNEIATSMSDMASGIVKIAETSSMVSEAAQEAASHAETGSVVVEQAVKQIGSIGEGTEKVGSAIERLNERSMQIEEILNFITEITSRIRLLSLNASIEAARAGEHGRGFAVVAEEVKKLAGQSESSTDQIAQLITEIRQDTLNAVEVMDVSRQDVREGVALIEDVREKFANILQATRNVADHILEVSAASEEMSAGSEQVTASVEELKSIANLTSNDAKNVAEAAEEQVATIQQISGSVSQLESVVSELRKELAKFKL